MSLSLIFWLCLFLMLIGGAWTYRAKPYEGGVAALVWIALLAVGWQAFGAPIK